MNVSVLEREPFVCEAAADQAELLPNGLASEAYQLLGYATKQAKAQWLQALQKTLEELDVRPFTEESVQRYKESREKQPSRWASVVVNLGGAAGVIAAVAGLPVLVVSALTMNEVLSFYLALGIIAGGIFMIICAAIGERFLVQRTWMMYDLKFYTDPVPEFALQTALDIKKKHPEVKFYICSLEENRMVLDPFLVMHVSNDFMGRDYYLEVWNEPTFSGKREA